MLQFMKTVLPTIESENSHRSRLLRARDAGLVTVISLSIIALSFLPVQASTSSVTAESVVQQVNLERVKHGLAPLQANNQLNEAAYQKAQDMVKKGYFAHYYQNQTPWDYLAKANVNDWQFAGENLAKNYQNPMAMVEAWMNSQLHRENILKSDYQQTGVAVVNTVLPNGEQVSVTVQLFTGV